MYKLKWHDAISLTDSFVPQYKFLMESTSLIRILADNMHRTILVHVVEIIGCSVLMVFSLLHCENQPAHGDTT